MRRVYLFLLPALFAGCSLLDGAGDAGTVTFTADQDRYRLGSTVTATLENNSDQVVEYNLCFSQLEQRSGSAWKNAGPEIVCQAIAFGLRTGEQDQYGVVLSDSLNLTEGPYRLTTSVSIGAEGRTLTTQTFAVGATR